MFWQKGILRYVTMPYNKQNEKIERANFRITVSMNLVARKMHKS